MEMNKKRELIIGGIILALGILFPIIFHTMGIMGQVFLPMHIPVLIGGFFLPPYLALITGIIVPFLSGVLTGMPPMYPMAVIMAFELGTYGMAASLAYRKFKLSVIPSLIVSMIAGRVTAGIVVFILANLFGVQMNPFVFVKGSIVTGFPGIVIQIIIIPTLVYSLNIYTRRATME